MVRYSHRRNSVSPEGVFGDAHTRANASCTISWAMSLFTTSMWAYLSAGWEKGRTKGSNHERSFSFNRRPLFDGLCRRPGRVRHLEQNDFAERRSVDLDEVAARHVEMGMREIDAPVWGLRPGRQIPLVIESWR